MAEYNFEPDYEAWWKRKNLALEELFPLACGLSPKAYKLWRQAYEPETRSPEQCEILNETQKFYSKRDNAASVKDIMVWLEHFLGNKKWNGNKNSILDLFYSYPKSAGINQHYLPSPHTDFIAYLKSIGELPEYVEKYNDSYFDIDYNTVNLTEITDEDAAISVILGCRIEPFKRWLKFSSGNHPVEDRTADDNAFWMACCEYFGPGSSIDDGGLSYLYFKFIKTLKKWNGDIIKYSEALYNEGVIYHENTQSYLEDKGAKLEYLENSWAYKFYKKWLQEDTWTLVEAALLFKGECPNSGRGYLDLSQDRFSYAYSVEHLDMIKCSITGKFDREFSDVVQKSIDAKNLKYASFRDGIYRFVPIKIVQWLLDKTEHRPPKPLLNLLGIKNEDMSALSISPARICPKEEERDINQKVMNFQIKYYKKHGKYSNQGPCIKHLQNNGYGMQGDEVLKKKFNNTEIKSKLREASFSRL